MNSNKNLDVIVVGSGVGGLSAAISLGSAGLRVLVLEAAAQIGGKAGVVNVEGVEFDTGPSVLTLPDTFDAIFAQAGLNFRELVRLRRPDPAFRYRFPSGATLDVFHELERTCESVGSVLGTKAREEFRHYLDNAKTIWDLAAPHFVLSEAPDLGGLLFSGISRLRALSVIDPLRTMQTAIERTVQTPELRTLLERYATYNGSDVRRAPATLGCIAHVELALGGFGVDGGIYQLVLALAQAAKHVGVEIRTQEPVAELLVRSGKIAGVRTEAGSEILAGCVVANTDLGQLVQTLLPPNLGKSLAPDGELSMSAYTAVYRAKKRPERVRVAHEVVFPSNYLGEFADIFDRQRSPEDPAVYLCAQSACHNRATWPDHEPVFVMANAPAVVAGSKDGDAKLLRERVEQTLRRADLITADDQTVFERSPNDLARRFPGSHGALYGLASNSPMSAFKRAPNEAKRIPGLYLAGASAHPGGGLPMVALSGQRAAEGVLRQVGVRRRSAPEGASTIP